VADRQGGRAGGEQAARLACQAGADGALGLPPATLARPKTWIDVLQKADKTVNRDPEAGFTTLIGFCLTSDRLTGAPYWRARALAVHALYDIAFDEELEEADIQLSRSRARTNLFGSPHSPRSTRISSFGRLIRDGMSRASPTSDRRHP
jgi:hypothetical protein